MASTAGPRSVDAASNGTVQRDVAVSALAAEVTPPRRSGRIWPFGVIPALITAGAVLVVLLVTVVVLDSTAHWPDKRWQGWLMLGVVLLAVTPLLLLILDRVAHAGGSVEFRGIKIAFAAEAAESAITLPSNMGIPPGLPVADSGGFQLQAAMREAVRNNVLVVDLEEGAAWWETRLLTLCVGAHRRGQVRAVVFIATDRTVARTFQGWATPGQLAQALLDANPEMRHAADNAEVTARRWHLAYPPSLPGADENAGAAGVNPLPDQRKVPNYYVPFCGPGRNAFADEQFLLNELAPFEQQPRPVTLVRLMELFGPILRAASFDELDPDDAWLRTALTLDDDYVAVTRGQIYVGMLSRSAVLARIVCTLASQSARS
jgi:hypothetical protein